MEIIKCEACNREFNSQEALDMHNSAKHYIPAKKERFKMKKKYKILAVIIILSVLLLYMTYKKQVSASNYDDFAKCLTENNATMYGTEWCTHCKAQKALFGKSFKYVSYIDCDRNKDICISMGVEGYPTWIIGNESYPGTQQIYTLSKLSKCEITETFK